MPPFELNVLYYVLTSFTSLVIILLALMLLGMHIAPDERLNKFRVARNYLSLSYLVLGTLGFIRLFTQQETGYQSLSGFFTLIVASLQALLFTYTILALIQPLYIKQKQLLTQLTIITGASIVLLLVLFFAPHVLYSFVFWVLIVAYFLQISYYTYLFRNKYTACLQTLENYYEDEEYARLKWVKYSFYSALAIGIFALSTLFLPLYFYLFFTVLYTVYYSYIVCRFYNYQIDFKFAIPAIYQPFEPNKERSIPDDEESKVKCEHFKSVLEKWVEEKKFTQKDISVEEIAASLNISLSFLQYYFRTYMETDFRTWRSGLRIREAQAMLIESPEKSLEEIRESVGFNHRANFHQQFTKISGLTPTEYRKQYTKIF